MTIFIWRYHILTDSIFHNSTKLLGAQGNKTTSAPKRNNDASMWGEKRLFQVLEWSANKEAVHMLSIQMGGGGGGNTC